MSGRGERRARCACPSRWADDCARIRYDLSVDEYDDEPEPCECDCHYEDEDEDEDPTDE